VEYISGRQRRGSWKDLFILPMFLCVHTLASPIYRSLENIIPVPASSFIAYSATQMLTYRSLENIIPVPVCFFISYSATQMLTYRSLENIIPVPVCFFFSYSATQMLTYRSLENVALVFRRILLCSPFNTGLLWPSSILQPPKVNSSLPSLRGR